MRTALRLALSDMLHDPLHSLFSAVGIASVVLVALVLNGTASGLENILKTAPLSSNLVVVDASFVDISDSIIGLDLIEGLSRWMPNPIQYISPVFYRQIRADERVVMLLAADPAYWETVHQIKLIEGTMSSGLREVMVGEGAKTIFGWEIGEHINIYGEEFQVTGIYSAAGLSYAALWIPMSAAVDMFGSKNTIQFLSLNIAAGVDLDALREELQESMLVKGQYSVFLEDSKTSRHSQLVRDLSSVLNLVSVLALLAIPLSTYSMTLLTLAERTRAMGIFRVVGFSPAAARWFLLLRSGWLTLGAYLLGWLGALAVKFILATGGPVMIGGVYFNLNLTETQALFFLVITLVFALAGAFFSSRRLLSQSVYELMQD